jgi:predicted RNA-binding protein YlxR (DUF448 family)
VTVADRVPVRTCVACRTRAPKSDLLRIVAGTEELVIDATATGRGAYVHRRPGCIDGVTAAGLARALRGEVSQDEVGRLRGILEIESGAR